jgi:hypothetical protein
MVTHVTNVRERTRNDTLIPERDEIGLLKTIITFDVNKCIDLRNLLTNSYQIAIDYVRYKQGSQILIPASYSVSIFRLISQSPTNTIYRGNTTILNPEYLINLNMNGC